MTTTPENSLSPDTHIESKGSKQRLRKIRKILARVAGTAGVLVAASIPLGQYYADDAMVGPRHAIDFITSDGPQRTPDAVRQQINELADSPTDPAFARMDAEWSKYTQQIPIMEPAGGFTPEQEKHYEELREKAERLRFEYGAQKAQEYGLHLVDPSSFEKKTKDATTIEEVTEALQEYTNSLGFQTTLPAGKDARDIGLGIELLKSNDMALEEYKKGVKYVIGAFSHTPVEVYKFMDNKELRIVKSVGEADNEIVGKFAPSGEANPVTGIIYLPYETLIAKNFAIPMHEFGHRMDYQLDGKSAIAAIRDKEYNDLNTEGFVYGDKNADLENNTNTPYDGVSAMEDKADKEGNMLNGLDTEQLYSDKSVIWEKYRLVLSRLEQHVPGYGRYLLAMTPHTKR